MLLLLDRDAECWLGAGQPDMYSSIHTNKSSPDCRVSHYLYCNQQSQAAVRIRGAAKSTAAIGYSEAGPVLDASSIMA